MVGFPIPYADEVFASVVERYLGRFRSATRGALLKSFGSGYLFPPVDFPSHLRRCAGMLPPGHPSTAESLLKNHTSFAWYAPFLPPQRVEAIRHACLEVGSDTIWTQSGQSSNRVAPPQRLRFCPHCLQADRESFRELHWRRVHQFTGIDVCARHSLFLEDSTVPRHREFKRQQFSLPDDSLFNVARRAVHNPVLIRLAALAEQLLSKEWPVLGLVELRDRYINLLIRAGFSKGRESTRIDNEKLRARLKEIFPAAFLAKCGCSDSGWLTRFVRGSASAQPPIRHLIMLTVLNADLDELFFPNPPDPPTIQEIDRSEKCQNLRCLGYQTADTDCIENKFSKFFNDAVCIFRCPLCGEVREFYKLRPDESRIRDYGGIWKEDLKTLWFSPDASYRDMTDILDVSADTIKRQAIKAGLPILRPNQYRSSVRRFEHLLKSKPELRQRKILRLRRSWLALRGKWPSLNCRQLRKRRPNLYAFLYRYDRDWLRWNQPKTQQWWPKGNPRIDWNKRDELLAQKIKDAAAAIRRQLPPSQRLSPSALCREVGLRDWLIKRLAKLPKCRAALFAEADVTVEFAMRHLNHHLAIDGVIFVPRAQNFDLFGTPCPVGSNRLLARDGNFMFIQCKSNRRPISLAA